MNEALKAESECKKKLAYKIGKQDGREISEYLNGLYDSVNANLNHKLNISDLQHIINQVIKRRIEKDF